MTGAAEPAEGKAATMVVLDLGKKKRRDIKRLRKGRGRLMDRLNETLDGLKDEGTIAESSQPIVVIIRERPRRKGFRLF
jgi:hypothetical protein